MHIEITIRLLIVMPIKTIIAMIVIYIVNTSLEVALERNKKRERSVPEYITIKSWKCSPIRKFQNLLPGNIIVDNSKDDRELTTITMNKG